MNAQKLFLVLMIAVAFISIIDGAVQEGKCNGKCEKGRKPHAKCMKSAKPCERTCGNPNAACNRATRQNFCQCDDGYVRKSGYGGKWDCVKPEEC